MPHDDTTNDVVRSAIARGKPISAMRAKQLIAELSEARADAKACHAALEAVKHFWLNDPLAFGDDATPTGMAGRFAIIAQICIDTLDLATTAGRE